MARAHDKLIAAAQAQQASTGRRERPGEPMTRQAIESFIAGFALSAAARRQIVERWVADQAEAHSEGYASGYEANSSYYD